MDTTHEIYQPKDSYLRIATACPEVAIADVHTNVSRIKELYSDAHDQDVSLLTFPELSLTGYTLGDLVNQTSLLDQAKSGLSELAEATQDKQTAMVVGLPLQVGNRLYNCAAVLADGKVQGIVPKQNLPTYNEFYERRWYDTWQEPATTVEVADDEVPFGNNLLFEVGGVTCGVEICEDLWVLRSPSINLVEQGAMVIANPSASPEQIAKAGYRRELVALQSAKMMGAYAYAGCHTSESTAEVVMGGHQLIAANGQVAAERKPFGRERLIVADVDIEHLELDRRKQHAASTAGAMVVKTMVRRQQENLRAHIDRNPFLPPESASDRAERFEAALNIQAHGLAMRLSKGGQKKVILGLSGGLDSTLALLVAHRAAGILGRDAYTMIDTLTMPGPASSDDTQSNAQILAKELGVQNTVIPIERLVNAELEALQHDGSTQDVTYENIQARARTSLLFNYANKHGGLVLGTGDLSEIALGWCTYNGDQQSHYNVNASIPKTLVKHLVRHVAEQPEYASASRTLAAILGTVISPELTKAEGDSISQSTEDIIGPYELHDFFLYHVVRWGEPAAKIQYLAEKAYAGAYSPEEIHNWLGVFVNRFVRSQFKRQNQPDGPKVGSVTLSQTGDWRMPPDMNNAAIWR
jgi:NAD+ synthase (glutamine-hydrolysing)